MTKRKTIFDDGFQSYLTEDAVLTGEPGIPMLMDLKNTDIPKAMIPFSKAARCKNHRQYVHFYSHDKEFSRVLTGTRRYLDLLKTYDGVITPDCTLLINQAKCLQQANTYMNRAVGFYLQKNGIRVIPNIRWSDQYSFDYAFLGVPKRNTVCVSTHGCIKTKKQKDMFKLGLSAMIQVLDPPIVLVHGYMPDYIFADFKDQVKFYRYPSEYELSHRLECKNGNSLQG